MFKTSLENSSFKVLLSNCSVLSFHLKWSLALVFLVAKLSLLSRALVSCHQFISVQSLNRVRLFVTPWIAARQASLSITNSWSSLRLMSIESYLGSNSILLALWLTAGLLTYQASVSSSVGGSGQLWHWPPRVARKIKWVNLCKEWATSLSLFTFMHWRRKW